MTRRYLSGYSRAVKSAAVFKFAWGIAIDHREPDAHESRSDGAP